MKILFAAGGSGGHITPALAVADIAKSQGVDCVFVGTGKQLERHLVENSGFRYRETPAIAVTGKGVKAIFRLTVSLPVLLFKAISLLRSEKPNLVFGTGGYPSVMPVVASLFLGIPRVIFEPNSKPGLANRVLSRIATKTVTVKGTSGLPKVDMKVNFPVRASFSKITPWQMPEEGSRIRVLVLGGSQGAKNLNMAILELLQSCSKDIEVTVQAGVKHEQEIRALLPQANVIGFSDDIPGLMSQAQLIISRAGANSVAEILEAKRPCIFVPLSIAEGHQRDNVLELEKQGKGWILQDDQALAGNIIRLVRELVEDKQKLQVVVDKIQSDASSTGAEEIFRWLKVET